MTNIRVQLLKDAADDCIAAANDLLNQAPSMGATKERKYRAEAEEIKQRSTALLAWAAELEGAAEPTREPSWSDDAENPKNQCIPPGERHKLNGYCAKCNREWIVACQSGTDVTVRAFHCACGHVTDMDSGPAE